MVAGTVDRVLVREGRWSRPVIPLAQLRGRRAARASDAAARCREPPSASAVAAARGDAAEQRLQRIREDVLRR